MATIFAFKEFSPQDNTAATIYYVSPDGSDTNSGTISSPWKTLDKAHSTISEGDTVILKPGVYPGYLTIRKNDTTWKSEDVNNKAILDGGFGPSLLEGDWRKVKVAWDRECLAKKNGMYVNIVDISADNVTLDGLFLRNSCGRAVLAREGSDGAKILNNRIDWTMSAGVYASAETKDLQFIGNEMTRVSFGDAYHFMDTGKYSVNISIHMSGVNMVVRNNIIAWGRGELAMTGSRNLLIEGNTFIGNKNNLYLGWAEDVIVRNNLIWSPEEQLNPGTHWEKLNGNDNDWHLSSRNEEDDRWPYTNGLENIAIYNNIIINNSIGFDGYHRKDTDDDNIKDYAYSTDTKKLYFGHNTIIAGTEDTKLLTMNFHKPAMADKDSVISGIFEHNIIDRSKNPDVGMGLSLSGNDNLTFRNNVLPVNVDQSIRGEGDIYTNTTGLDNPLVKLNFPIPAIGAATVDMVALRNAVDLNNYRLNQNSPAINAAPILSSTNDTQIPDLSKSQDYFRNSRIGVPDIGAIEFGGVYHTSTPTPIQTATTTPTPIQSATPTPTTIPGSSPTPTSTPIVENTPTPTMVTANICGRADSDNNGVFDITDFVTFAAAYQDGNRTCDDTAVNYGVCGGRDVDRDGRLNIADFGGTNGFASRYFPKTSCSLN